MMQVNTPIAHFGSAGADGVAACNPKDSFQLAMEIIDTAESTGVMSGAWLGERGIYNDLSVK